MQDYTAKKASQDSTSTNFKVGFLYYLKKKNQKVVLDQNETITI